MNDLASFFYRSSTKDLKLKVDERRRTITTVDVSSYVELHAWSVECKTNSAIVALYLVHPAKA